MFSLSFLEVFVVYLIFMLVFDCLMLKMFRILFGARRRRCLKFDGLLFSLRANNTSSVVHLACWFGDRVGTFRLVSWIRVYCYGSVMCYGSRLIIYICLFLPSLNIFSSLIWSFSVYSREYAVLMFMMYYSSELCVSYFYKILAKFLKCKLLIYKLNEM